jgi:tetratricopeptide (TPR) repeat protein
MPNDPTEASSLAISEPEPGPASFELPASLKPGDVVADRFVVERLAGRGGMGAVYQALDRTSGARVALKTMMREGGNDERFAQESRVLAELSHPAIVRYVAHGTTPDGQPFLAMEWLEGEDLAARLARSGLSAAESLTVVRRVTEGLASAHARGVVHRDIKPSNIFLVASDPAQAKLLDFGIVRVQLSASEPSARPMTGTGMILGTVGYMSPEQAVADRALDARTDIFALGCVLHECLTGQPTFSGAHVVAVLVKVLWEDAPRLRQLRPEVPADLDNLVARMLSKDKTGRPADGASLLRELDELGAIPSDERASEPRSSLRLSASEQRLVSVMLAVELGAPERVSEIVRRYGGELARLANGALLVTMNGRGSMSEQAIAAALCALELHRAFPSSRIALSIARELKVSAGSAGPVIDRAATLLSQSTSPGIRIDDGAAGLLGQRFDLRATSDGALLIGRQTDLEPPRTLLGRPTPCVGRDKELTLLEGTLRECIDDSVARAVLVTGPAGQGKSRLRNEFLRKVHEKGDVKVLSARADPVGAGSAFMMARQLVSNAVGLRDGDEAQEQSKNLRAYVADVCKKGDSARIADFLGELVGVPSVESPGSELDAARNDPQIMAAWLGRSFGEWLEAECSTGPVLVVLEDLHWGDLSSVTYLSEGLRALSAKPFMVLALARPEVHQAFPRLWKGADGSEVSLGRLAPRAAERLVRGTLGEKVASDAVARIVERADGNAFYLEELIRRVGEGNGDTLPETVLALAQSRLDRLEPDARRILRAASVFGDVFWRGGLSSLLGGAAEGADVDRWLEALVRDELVSVALGSRYRGEQELTFRHGLLREAAYEMLTDADRTTGHRLAAEWLEGAGETQAVVVAGHFERGLVPDRAAVWYRAAATQALEGNDLAGVIACAERGMACGASGVVRGELAWLRSDALQWRGDPVEAMRQGTEALELLPYGSSTWWRACGTLICAASSFDDQARAERVAREMLAATASHPCDDFGFVGMAVATHTICDFGPAVMRDPVVQALQEAHRRLEPHPRSQAWFDLVQGVLSRLDGDSERAITLYAAAADGFRHVGDLLGGSVATNVMGSELADLGSPRADAALIEASEILGRLGRSQNVAEGNRAMWLLNEGRVSDAERMLRGCIAEADARREPIDGGAGRSYLSTALQRQGKHREAEQEARAALALLGESGIYRPRALAALASALLAQGRCEEALQEATTGFRALEESIFGFDGDAFIRLIHAEALHANGLVEEARAAIGGAAERICRRADNLRDRDLRASFLERVPENARTIALAHSWGPRSAPA